MCNEQVVDNSEIVTKAIEYERTYAKRVLKNVRKQLGRWIVPQACMCAHLHVRGLPQPHPRKGE